MEIFAQYGKSDTAVAIIQDGTTAKEKMVAGKVKDIAYRVQYAGLSNPAIIIIGEVVRLSNALQAVDSAKEPAAAPAFIAGNPIGY
jgi:uroporphyrin-III C-methyltransferase